MCDLCVGDDAARKFARKDLLSLAKNLERLGGHYRKLACGEIAPHSAEFSAEKTAALRIVRTLVEDWVH